MNEEPTAPQNASSTPDMPSQQPMSGALSGNKVPAAIPPKSKKPLTILLILLTLLGIGGAAYYFFFYIKDATPTQTAVNQIEIPETVPNQFFYDDTNIYYIDKDQKVKVFAHKNKTDLPLEARNVEGSTRIYYETRSTDEIPLLLSVSYHTGSNSQKLYDFPEGTYSYTGSFISPDGSKLIYETTDVQSFTPDNLTLVDLTQKTSKVVFEPTKTQLRDLDLIEWLDEENVVYRDGGCRECDGAPPPILFQLNLKSGEWREVYNGETEDKNSAGFWHFLGAEYYIIDVGNHARYFENSDENGKPYPLYIISLKTADWTEKQLKRYDNDSSNLVGVGDKSAYITTANLIETTEGDPNIVLGNETGVYAYDKPVLRKLNTETGAEVIVELGASMNEKVYIREVYETADGLYLYVQESTNKIENGERKDSTLYKVYLLPPGASEMVLIYETIDLVIPLGIN